MSHFSVTVVLRNLTVAVPSPHALRRLSAALAPFHEFECTGNNDQYVQEVDITDSLLDEYGKRVEVLYHDAEGNPVLTSSVRMWREPTESEMDEVRCWINAVTAFPAIVTGRTKAGALYHVKDWGDGRRAMRVFDDTGFIKATVEATEMVTFDEFAASETGYHIVRGNDRIDLNEAHKWGFILVDAQGAVKVIRRTNPNKKWDWWVVGGRFNNTLRLKPSHLGTDVRVDAARVEDIDFEAMRQQAVAEANATYDTIEQVFAGTEWPPKPWAEFFDEGKNSGRDIESLRDEYNAYSAIAAHNRLPFKHKLRMVFGDPSKVYNCTRDEFVNRAVQGEGVTFALLVDGQWYERGEMGWFGCVSNERPQQDWNTFFHDTMSKLDPNDAVYVVDCHI